MVDTLQSLEHPGIQVQPVLKPMHKQLRLRTFSVDLFLKGNVQHRTENCISVFNLDLFCSVLGLIQEPVVCCIHVLGNLSLKQKVRSEDLSSLQHFIRHFSVVHTHWDKLYLHCMILNRTSQMQQHPK